jgi:crotonobetainyl-CoA:carnitine CoA-transferase CaiB-like acyl-CoA transferase
VVSPLPDPGAHTDQILRGLGYSAGEIADLRSRKIV